MLKIQWKYDDLPASIKFQSYITGAIPLAVYSGETNTIWLDWEILRYSPIVLVEAFFHEFVHYAIYRLLYPMKLMWVLQKMWDTFDLKVVAPATIKLISKTIIKERNIRLDRS